MRGPTKLLKNTHPSGDKNRDILLLPSDPLFREITELAGQICDAPISLVSLVDREYRILKSIDSEIDLAPARPNMAFCSIAILGDKLFEVPDALEDRRFINNPLVEKEANIRFYAGMPLLDKRGLVLGTLCVIDQKPRRLTQAQRSALERLSNLVISLIEQQNEKRLSAEREYHQRLILDFGQRALTDLNPALLMSKAIHLISATMRFEYCRVFRLANNGYSLVEGASIGWPPSEQGQCDMDDYTRNFGYQVLARGIPTVMGELAAEDQLQYAEFQQNQKLISGLGVIIPGPGKPLGILTIHSAKEREITADLIHFLQSIANIIASSLIRKQAEERVLYLAQYDELTGLPNRHQFQDRINNSIGRARHNGKPIAVLVLNLDGFKLINNSHSHAVGDKVLRDVAQRLVRCVRNGDTVSRLGVDGFGIALVELAKVEDTTLIIQKILKVLARPFELDNDEVFFSASVGASLYDADGQTGEALVKNAEIAMHRAKENGRNLYQFYDPEMNLRALQRVRMEAGLRRALERGEFELQYQPKFDVSTAKYCGVEALLRWRNPDCGLISPDVFIPVLEETGLIVPVGFWVLEKACEQLKNWHEEGVQVPSIAVNLSARQFRDVELDVKIQEYITLFDVPAGGIQLEITESVLMHDPSYATEVLTKLKHLGVRLSVDDFGTGYSSLAYLKQFPLDELKIDRTFISEISDVADDAAIVLAIINLAHSLNLSVVAEGVETNKQVIFLEKNGCEVLQGFYFSEPIDACSCAAFFG